MSNPTRHERTAQLARLRQESSSSPTPTNLLATASAICMEIQNGAVEYLDELRSLSLAHREIPGIPGLLGRALYSAIFYEDDLTIRATLFEEFRKLVVSDSHDAGVRYGFGMAISYLTQNDKRLCGDLRAELRALAARYPDDADLKHWVSTLD